MRTRILGVLATVLLLVGTAQAADIELFAGGGEPCLAGSATSEVVSGSVHKYLGWNFPNTGSPCMVWHFAMPADMNNTAIYSPYVDFESPDAASQKGCWYVKTAVVGAGSVWGDTALINTSLGDQISGTTGDVAWKIGTTGAASLRYFASGAVCNSGACSHFNVVAQLQRDNSGNCASNSAYPLRVLKLRIHY